MVVEQPFVLRVVQGLFILLVDLVQTLFRRLVRQGLVYVQQLVTDLLFQVEGGSEVELFGLQGDIVRRDDGLS